MNEADRQCTLQRIFKTHNCSFSVLSCAQVFQSPYVSLNQGLPGVLYVGKWTEKGAWKQY